VSGIQQMYTAFLNATKTDSFTCFKMRLKTTLAMAPYVFAMNIKDYTKSFFGKGDFNDIPVGSQESPMQQKDYILDLDCKFEITKEKGLALVVPYNFAISGSYNILISLFINQFSSLR